jgi:uncharacterized protein
MNWPLIILIGLTSGTLSGLLGIGGGVIMVPLFYYLLGMELPRAIGTSLAIIIPTSLAGSITHSRLQNIDYKILLGVAVFAIIGSIIGALLTSHLSTAIIRKTFALVLAAVAIKLFLEP